MTKDLITKESKALEEILKHFEYAPDLCPVCGNNVKVTQKIPNTLSNELPRRKECLSCKTRFFTKEFITHIEE